MALIVTKARRAVGLIILEARRAVGLIILEARRAVGLNSNRRPVGPLALIVIEGP